MRHLRAHRKLGRTTEHRLSLLRNLATSLINARNEQIVTTLPKAKELRPFIERVITLSRRAQNLTGDDTAARAVHLRRQAAAFFHAGNRGQAASAGRRGQERAPRTAGVAAVKRLFDELGERYKDRPGGYTRIIKLGRRAGDNAELAIIELVDNPREREAAAQAGKRAKSAGARGQKRARAAKESEGGRRGGRKTEAKDADKAGRAGRRAKKTESTAAEQESE